MTFSLVASDVRAGQWGVAVASKFLAVGAVVPWAAAGVGAIATQAWANPRYGPDGLDLLRQGLSAGEVVGRLVSADEGRDERQLGVVDSDGHAVVYTGVGCLDWAGHVSRNGYTAQGNLLVSSATVEALADTFEATEGMSLAERLLTALAAAQAAGGDRRGQQSASLLVVSEGGGYGGLSDVLVDLRVDDHERPVDELQRLYAIHERLFGKTPRDEWLPLEGVFAEEVHERLVRLGYERLEDWAGVENLEERLGDGAAIDPVVLEALREATP